MVSSTPRPHFTPGKNPAPILQEAGWAPGPVWTGGKSRPHRDSIPDRPARSRSLYRLSYLAHKYYYYVHNTWRLGNFKIGEGRKSFPHYAIIYETHGNRNCHLRYSAYRHVSLVVTGKLEDTERRRWGYFLFCWR